MKFDPVVFSAIRMQLAAGLMNVRARAFGLSLTPCAAQEEELDRVVATVDRLIEKCLRSNPLYVAEFTAAPMPDAEFAWLKDMLGNTGAVEIPAVPDPDAANAAAANADAVSMAAALQNADPLTVAACAAASLGT